MEKATWGYRLKILLPFAVSHIAVYLYPNFNPFYPPLTLPLSWVDRAIPLVPWTFMIYNSDYVLGAVAILLVSTVDAFNAFSRRAFLALFLCGTFFVFCPTIYPRPPYPVTDNAFINLMMQLVSLGDSPLNCFPSLHVAITTVCTFSLLYRGPKIALTFVAWSIAIFISTLTTKQHYLIDLVGGSLVAALAIGVNWLVFEKPTFRGVWPKSSFR